MDYSFESDMIESDYSFAWPFDRALVESDYSFVSSFCFFYCNNLSDST
jgi:hypothetical protein